MPDYLWPCAWGGVSDTFWDHKNRTPPSVNPGTDITCGYGSDVWATRAGTVTAIGWSNSGSGGRYVQVSNDNGTRSQYLHLSRIDVTLGQRVGQGQHLAASGASGFGSDWGYGPHLHKSLMINGINVDFQLYSSPTGWSAGDIQPITPEEELFLMSQFDDLWARTSEAIARLDNEVIPATRSLLQSAADERTKIENLQNDESEFKRAVQNESRGRFLFDAGPDGKTPLEKSPRAVVIKNVTAFIYPLNPDPAARAGQITSIQQTHYLLVGLQEYFEGLPTQQFDNAIEMVSSQRRAIANEVVRQLRLTPAELEAEMAKWPVVSAEVPAGIFPARGLAGHEPTWQKVTPQPA